MASAIIRSVVANAITGGGPTQDFTISGFGTPVAAMIVVTSRASSFGVADEMQFSWGITDGTFEGGVAARDRDNVGTTDVKQLMFDNAMVRLPSPSGTTFDAVAVFSAFITDGIRLSWSTIPSTAYQVIVTLWGGDDVSAAAGTAIPTTVAGANVKITTGSFEPDHLVIAAGRNAGAADETFFNNMNLTFAQVVNLASTPGGGSGADVRSMCLFSSHNVGTTFLRQTLDDDQVGIRIRTTTDYFRGTKLDDTTPFESDGFNIETTVAGIGTAAGPRIFYLALNYGGKRVFLSDEVVPGSTGTQSYTFGMKPDSMLGFQSNTDTSGTVWANLENVLGDNAEAGGPWFLQEGGDAYSVSLQHDDNVGTSNTSSRNEDDALHLTAVVSPFVGAYVANLDSIDIDGVTLDFTTVLAKRFVIFALETEDVIADPGPAITMPAMGASATGLLTIQGTSAVLMASTEVAGQGLLVVTGTGTALIPAMLAVGTGNVLEELFCDSELLGSFQSVVALIGSHQENPALLGAHQENPALLGSHEQNPALLGSHDQDIDQDGSVC